MKLVIYTALFTDNIEHVHGVLPEYDTTSIDFICFTNTPHLKSNTWNIKQVSLDIPARLQARKYKTMPHLYLQDYDSWFWMDNACVFKYDPANLFEYYMKDFDVGVHEHCDRTNIFQEAETIISRKLDDPVLVTKQMQRYQSEGYVDTGLFETGILMRRNNEKVKKFNEDWWNEINNYSLRDQLSLPYVLWKNSQIQLNQIKETFIAHQSALNKKQSEHFYTVPRSKVKLT